MLGLAKRLRARILQASTSENDLKTMVVKHALDVACAGKIIVDADNIGALLEQALAKVGAEKSGAAGD